MHLLWADLRRVALGEVGEAKVLIGGHKQPGRNKRVEEVCEIHFSGVVRAAGTVKSRRL